MEHKLLKLERKLSSPLARMLSSCLNEQVVCVLPSQPSLEPLSLTQPD